MTKRVILTILSVLTILSASLAFTGCATAKHTASTSNHTYLRDSVTVLDTVMHHVHIADAKADSAKLDILTAKNDSLSAELATSANELQKLAASLDTAVKDDVQSQQVRDSLSTVIAKQSAQIAKLSKQVKTSKLNTDTLTAKTDVAQAWAVVQQNELKLWLEQAPIDTLLAIVHRHTKVTETTIDESSTETVVEVEKMPPFYRNYWFYICMCIILAIVAFAALKSKLTIFK